MTIQKIKFYNEADGAYGSILVSDNKIVDILDLFSGSYKPLIKIGDEVQTSASEYSVVYGKLDNGKEYSIILEKDFGDITRDELLNTYPEYFDA